MAQITITQKYVRISPRKLRAMASIIKGKSAQDLLDRLPYVATSGASLVRQSLKNAVQIAESKNLTKDRLSVVGFKVNEGPRLKRSMPVARGRMSKITKKMSHIVLTLSDEINREFVQK